MKFTVRKSVCNLQIATCVSWFGLAVPWLQSALLDDWEATSSLGCSRAFITGGEMEPALPCDRPLATWTSSNDLNSCSCSHLPGEETEARRGTVTHPRAWLWSCCVNSSACMVYVSHWLPARMDPASRPRGWGHCTCTWHLGFTWVFPVPDAPWSLASQGVVGGGGVLWD